jgi:hypothetical protein
MVIASDATAPGPQVTREPYGAMEPPAATVVHDGGGMGVVVPPPPDGDEHQEVVREDDGVSEQRMALVNQIIDDVKRAKAHWDRPFKQMMADMEFAGGDQWPKVPEQSADNMAPTDPRYVANITLRHVQQKVSALYARNPKIKATRRRRLTSKVWDGTQAQVTLAMQLLQQNPMNTKAMQIVQDYNTSLEYNQLMDKIADTLEILYEYQISEQDYPFKSGMKRMVRRAVTAGVGYVKLGFQRLMRENPDVTARIADYSERLATLERLSSDVKDGEIEPDTAETENLRLILQDMQGELEVVAREGLIYSYPLPWNIIPDTDCMDLNTFLGSTWVAEEMPLTPEKVQEIYDVDVKSCYTPYAPGSVADTATAAIRARLSGDTGNTYQHSVNGNKAMVWQVWNRATGLVYTVCDGWKDFLEDPRSPEAWTERFWPWFSLTLNDLEHPTRIFPPSRRPSRTSSGPSACRRPTSAARRATPPPSPRSRNPPARRSSPPTSTTSTCCSPPWPGPADRSCSRSSTSRRCRRSADPAPCGPS